MRLRVDADLEMCYGEQVYRLVSTAEGLEFRVPSIAAATALLRLPDVAGLARRGETLLQATGQTVRVTYRNQTLATLGTGSWTLSALSNALDWLQ